MADTSSVSEHSSSSTHTKSVCVNTGKIGRLQHRWQKSTAVVMGCERAADRKPRFSPLRYANVMRNEFTTVEQAHAGTGGGIRKQKEFVPSGHCYNTQRCSISAGNGLSAGNVRFAKMRRRQLQQYLQVVYEVRLREFVRQQIEA